MSEKKFFVIKRNDVGVEIIRLLKNFNTTKVALFRGSVQKKNEICIHTRKRTGCP